MVILSRIYPKWNSVFATNSEQQMERELDFKLGLLGFFSPKGTHIYLFFPHSVFSLQLEENTKLITLTPI